MCRSLALVFFTLFLPTLSFSAIADSTAHTQTQAETEPVIFILSPANKPPFWYQQAGQTQGLVPELLGSIASELKIELQMMQVPRKRGIELVRKQPRTLMGLAAEWVSDPENFLFSDPVSHTQDVLVSHQKDPVILKRSADELDHRILGTHFGYHYPTLEHLFDNGQLTRSDSHSEEAIIERLRRQRISVAVMTQAVARWYRARDGWHDELYIDSVTIASAKMRLMAHPSEQPLIQQINRAVERRRLSGELQVLHRKHYLQAAEPYTLIGQDDAPTPAAAL